MHCRGIIIVCYAPIIMQLYNQAATCELTKAMTGGCRGFRRDFRELTAKLQKHGIRGLGHLRGFVKNVSIVIAYWWLEFTIVVPMCS